MRPDPTIDAVREARRRISEKCGYDPKELVEYYMRLEREEFADRLVVPSKPKPQPEVEEAG
jgi:hypothetical protein